MASREPGTMLAFALFQGFIREMSVYISSIYNDAVEGLDEGAHPRGDAARSQERRVMHRTTIVGREPVLAR